MGICSSCLGFGRRSRGVENPEASRLLYDDPYRSQYGATSQTQHRVQYHQPDPEAIRQQTELICQDMSDHVLDVFTSLPQSGQANNNHTSSSAASTDASTPIAKASEESFITKKHEPSSQEMKYKSVRAAPGGARIWRDMSGDPKKLAEAKAVMEGSGERG